MSKHKLKILFKKNQLELSANYMKSYGFTSCINLKTHLSNKLKIES